MRLSWFPDAENLILENLVKSLSNIAKNQHFVNKILSMRLFRKCTFLTQRSKCRQTHSLFGFRTCGLTCGGIRAVLSPVPRQRRAWEPEREPSSLAVESVRFPARFPNGSRTVPNLRFSMFSGFCLYRGCLLLRFLSHTVSTKT